jgi:hypothetical protein
MIKPISLVKPYRTAWNEALINDNARSFATQLNSQATDLVLGYLAGSRNRTKLKFGGDLKTIHRTYIGYKTAQRDAGSEIVRTIEAEGPCYEDDEDQGIVTATE